ncbi:MAG TPA: hypothetical protein VKG63_02395 [Steroidobacteraceae bacterium]|nr:hypothetical protein [Steroidobacteraceae bacterium]
MRTLWMVVFCLAAALTLATPKRIQMASLETLKAAITTKLGQDSARCQGGNHDSCQDAVLDTVGLNDVNSEIALRTLESGVKSRTTKDIIEDAIIRLRDVDTALSEIREKVHE